jgi:hypothetical protein
MKALVAATAATLLTGGAALAYTKTKLETVPAGKSAVFLPSGWRCINFRTLVQCGNDDSYPEVILTSTSKGALAVKVVTRLGAQTGMVARIDDRASGHRIYTFSGTR